MYYQPKKKKKVCKVVSKFRPSFTSKEFRNNRLRESVRSKQNLIYLKRGHNFINAKCQIE